MYNVNCDCCRFVCLSWEPSECLETLVQSSSFSGKHHDEYDDYEDDYEDDHHDDDYHDDHHEDGDDCDHDNGNTDDFQTQDEVDFPPHFDNTCCG